MDDEKVVGLSLILYVVAAVIGGILIVIGWIYPSLGSLRKIGLFTILGAFALLVFITALFGSETRESNKEEKSSSSGDDYNHPDGGGAGWGDGGDGSGHGGDGGP